MELDVVIPTWNRADLLDGALASLERQEIAHHTIVVDNGSTDGTRELLAERHPSAGLVALPHNLGFGAAVNRGVAAGHSEVLVLINNDVVLEDGFLAQIVAPFADAQIGMVAGVLVDPRSGLIDAAGIEIDGSFAGYSFAHGAALSSLHEEPRSLLGPCGGAAAYRRTAFEAVGGFDERIFAYSEDVDLALRLRAAGWHCRLAPAARATHLGSATLGARSVRQTRIAGESRGYLLGRYRPPPPWLLAELAIAAVDAVLLRSSAPVAGRLRGWVSGRRQPPIEIGGLGVESLRWREALRRRWRSARPQASSRS